VAARRGGGARKGSPRNEPSMYVRGRSQRGGASLLLQGLADTWAWENDRRSPAVQPLSRAVRDIQLSNQVTMC